MLESVEASTNQIQELTESIESLKKEFTEDKSQLEKNAQGKYDELRETLETTFGEKS